MQFLKNLKDAEKRSKFIQKVLRYANLPILGFFVYAMGFAHEHHWNRWLITGLFFSYALVRVLINLWLNKDQVLFAGEMIRNMRKKEE